MPDKDREQLEAEELQRLHAYKKAFGGEHGKIVLRDLIDASFMSSPTITGEEFSLPGASTLMTYREGLRGLMLHIMFELQVKPDELLQELSDE